VLVGTKSDMRTSKQAIEELKKNNEEPITQEQGMDMAKQIGAYKYVECSAKTQHNLATVFEESVRFVVPIRSLLGTFRSNDDIV